MNSESDHVDGYKDESGKIDFALSKEAAQALLAHFEQVADIMRILRLHPEAKLHPHVAAFVRELRRVTK